MTIVTYDTLGRQLTVAVPNMATYDYQYDIMGQATKIIHGAETISYLYDDLGRVTTETDSSNRTMGYDYNDAAGTWDIKYNGNNYWIRYATDDASRLSTITEHKSGSASELMATYGYDTGSRVKSLLLGTTPSIRYSQGVFSFHFLFSLSKALAIIISLRIMAVMTTLNGFPAAIIC